MLTEYEKNIDDQHPLFNVTYKLGDLFSFIQGFLQKKKYWLYNPVYSKKKTAILLKHESHLCDMYVASYIFSFVDLNSAQRSALSWN